MCVCVYVCGQGFVLSPRNFLTHVFLTNTDEGAGTERSSVSQAGKGGTDSARAAQPVLDGPGPAVVRETGKGRGRVCHRPPVTLPTYLDV